MDENTSLIYKLQHEKKYTIHYFGNTKPSEEINNVMKRFYKVDKSRKHNSSFGIGLSIASRIVKNYNGEIFISSELDKYTKVTVVFKQ